MLLLLLFLMMADPNAMNCTTTFTMTDCDDKAVANAIVSFQTCDTNTKYSQTTGADGKVSFSVCASNICAITIETEVSTHQVSANCSGAKESNCSFKICD